MHRLFMPHWIGNEYPPNSELHTQLGRPPLTGSVNLHVVDVRNPRSIVFFRV